MLRDRTTVEKSMCKRVLCVSIFAIFISATIGCSKDKVALRDGYIAKGDSYVAQKKYPDAIIEYRNAVNQDSTHGQARFKLASAYENAGQLQSALSEFVRAADLMPQNAEAQLLAAKYLVAAGRFDEGKSRAMS